MSIRSQPPHNQVAHLQPASYIPTDTSFADPPQIVKGYEAKPITLPQSVSVPESYRCVVDYNHQPFSITWHGSSEYPDLTTFPFLQNVNVSSIYQNPNLATIWRESTLLDYGSHASIRITKHCQFPILKLAHSDELSTRLLQHEFDILPELKTLKLPVVEFDEQPILDNGVTSGYRMKRLSKLDQSDLSSRADDIRQTLDRLHTAGFSHGDFSPSNIMKDESDRVTLIDFSFAGRLGTAVPSFFPPWVYTAGIYNIDSDLEAFN